MKVEELKSKIENKTITDDGMIFVVKGDEFLAKQYYKEISSILGRPVSYKTEIDDGGFFGYIDSGELVVVHLDECNLESLPPHHIVIAKKSKSSLAVAFPELEDWQIKDYVYSVADGADAEVLDKILSLKGDMFRLQNELDKITIFDERVRKTISQQMLDNDTFCGLSSVDTFAFVNAVKSHNIVEIARMYPNQKIDAFAFVALLLTQVTNMVNVCLQSSPTEENTGLKSKQIWAIKNACKQYSRNQIFDIFKFLLYIDYEVKSGNISTDILLDYVLNKVTMMLGR